MPHDPSGLPVRSLRPFWITMWLLAALLAAAGAIFAQIHEIPAATAAPIVAAVLIQMPLIVLPGFPAAREVVTAGIQPRVWAGTVLAGSLLPYLAYTLPSGLFVPLDFLRLAALCLAVVTLYAWIPPRELEHFHWQDATALALLAYPMVSGLSPMLREIYVSPIPGVEDRFDFMGKLMLIGLGANAFLLLRGVPGADYRFVIRARDLKTGVENFLWFLPVGVPVALATGFSRWSPAEAGSWQFPAIVAANLAGVFLVVALSEEMFFRGVLQNLLGETWRRPGLAQFVASILFGLVHLGRGWQNALLAAIVGWFAGRAFRKGGGVVPAAITHTLAVIFQRFLFQ